MAKVALENLTLRYPRTRSAGLFACTLQIDDGETLAVVGPSGSGKTTLLRLIAGLQTPDAGSVQIGCRDVTNLPAWERDVALVAQRPLLYPHLSVQRNLSIGQEMREACAIAPRLGKEEMQLRVDSVAALLGLEPLVERRPHQLSGGEMQRVALGRALVRRPAVLLLDEPFSHLDVPMKLRFRHQLLLLRERSPTTMIFVTHDPDEAAALGQRLAVLHEGQLWQVGPPAAVIARPDHRCVAEILGVPPMNLVHGAWAGSGSSLRFAAADGTILLPMPAELVTHGAEGQPVTVGIRPEDLSPVLSAASAPPQDKWVTLTGWVVRLVESMPPRQLVVVARGRWVWSFWDVRETTLRVGESISLGFELDKCHWFDADGRRLRLRGE